jgi:hypothetical protein
MGDRPGKRDSKPGFGRSWRPLTEHRRDIVAEQGEELVRLINRFCLVVEKSDLRSPYQ